MSTSSIYTKLKRVYIKYPKTTLYLNKHSTLSARTIADWQTALKLQRWTITERIRQGVLYEA